MAWTQPQIGPALTGGWRLGLTVGAGVAAGLGQAPFFLWFLALPAWALGLWLIASAPRPAVAGWLFGLGYFGLALMWIVEPFLVDIARHGALAPFGLTAMAGGMALFWGAAGWALTRLAAGVSRRLIALVLLLALAEFARAYLFSGFPWAHPGHALIDTAGLQLAALAGPHGLTLVWLAGAAAIAAVSCRYGLWRGAAALAVPLVALALWPVPPAPAPAADAPQIRLIQPNAPQHLKWRPEMIPVFFDRAIALTGEGPSPDLVIWPELSVAVPLDASSVERRAIAAAARGAPTLIGIQRFAGLRAHNALAQIAPDGAIADYYDKHHLVPFGEYLPFPGLMARLGIDALAVLQTGGFAPGSGPRLLDLGPELGRVFPMICYEAIFPHHIRQTPRPDWMVHITNDAWFGDLIGPYQHLAIARLRAAEQGLPVLRAANTGVSAVIDARGQIVAALPLGEAGALDAALPAARPSTPYARWGDLPIFVLILSSLAVVFVTRRRTRD